MLSGNMISQLIPFIIAPILTRIFNPVEFAVVANFMAIVGILGIIATGRLELAVPLPKEHSTAQNLVFTGLVITGLLGILSIAFPLFGDTIGRWYNDDVLPVYLWLVPISVISYGFLGLANNWALRHRRFRNLSAGKISQSLINNVLAAVLGYLGWGIYGLITAWLLSQYIGVLVVLIGVDRKVKRRDFNILTIKTTLREYKDFPLINSLHAFTDIFATQFLLFWLIVHFFGSYELGLFAMMHRYVRAPIVIITSSVSQLFYVEAGKALNEDRSIIPILLKTVRTSILFAIPFVLVIIGFGPMIFKWYLGAEWERAGVYAQSMVPILFMMFVVSPISGIPILLNRQKAGFLWSLFAYTLALTALFLAARTGMSFGHAIWFYSGGFCVYYIAILIWYYRIATQKR